VAEKAGKLAWKLKGARKALDQTLTRGMQEFHNIYTTDGDVEVFEQKSLVLMILIAKDWKKRGIGFRNVISSGRHFSVWLIWLHWRLGCLNLRNLKDIDYS